MNKHLSADLQEHSSARTRIVPGTRRTGYRSERTRQIRCSKPDVKVSKSNAWQSHPLTDLVTGNCASSSNSCFAVGYWCEDFDIVFM